MAEGDGVCSQKLRAPPPTPSVLNKEYPWRLSRPDWATCWTGWVILDFRQNLICFARVSTYLLLNIYKDFIILHFHFDTLCRAGPKRKARGRPTLGVHWLLSNNRLEKVPFASVPHTFSNRLLLSNQDKGCTPSVAHSLGLPLGPALHNVWTVYVRWYIGRYWGRK